MTRIVAFAAIATLLSSPAAFGVTPPVSLPVYFEPNEGQHDASIQFTARLGEGRLSLSEHEAVFGDASGAALRMVFEGAEEGVQIRGGERLDGQVNYFVGTDPAKWRTEIATYARVRYEQLYPGIDLVFYSTSDGRLEYDFVVAPGADPSRIRLRVEGAGGVRIGEDGGLIARTSAGEIRHQAPVVYQMDGDERREVVGRYRLDDGVLRFEIEGHDHARELVIDPVVMFSSFLGGAGNEDGRGIAVDADGNIYLTGSTLSNNFPTQNPLQANRSDTQADVYVTKVNAMGTALIFSTYIGGASGDEGRGIAVGSDGSVYVGGTAGSSFPVTAGAFQTQPGLQGDAFLLKLNPAGSQLVYATLIAGARSDVVAGVAVDAEGNLYATGHTASDNFPVTAGAAQAVRPTMANSNDGFVLKLNPMGTALVYSTLVGGTDDDESRAIAVKDGFAYVAGTTESNDLATTAGVFQPAFKGTHDAFVAKVNLAGSAFAFLTYLGGTNVDEALGLAVDVFDEVYVTGTTLATDFPVSETAFQKTRKSGEDGFVAKLNAAGSALVYATYLGSATSDQLSAIAVDRHGAAYVIGWSSNDFPVTAQALQAQDGGATDLVIVKVGSDGSRLLYSSFMGGTGTERSGQDGGDGGGNTIAQRGCIAYITGRSFSNNFPVTDGVFQPVRAGGDDTIFAKIDSGGDLGEPQMGCAAGYLAPLRPLVDMLSPRSIGTVFGINFSSSTGLSPQVGANGLITTNLANTCLEIDGRRVPMNFVNATQINFQVPVETSLGWVRLFVIRNCDQANAVRSEPLFVEVKPVLPEFFIFLLPDLAIAATDDTASAAAGTPVFVGPASAGAPYTPAGAGNIVSAYFTAGGTTNPPLGTGQIPGGAFAVTGNVTVMLGSVVIPPADVFYVGGSPCCAGLDQLTFRVPANMPPGNHQLVLTIGGVSSQNGPFIAVQ